MDTQVLSLAEKLNYVIGGKAHRGYFDSVKVYSFMEWVPLPTAASVTPVSDSELFIEAYEPSNAPLVELAIRKSGVQAEVTRDFGVVKVKILGYDKEAALKETRRLGEEAKESLLSIKEKTAAKVGEDTQALGKLEAVTQARIRMVDELVAIKEESLV
jgi:ribosome recycling factor